MRDIKFRAWNEEEKYWYNPRFVEMNLLGQAVLRFSPGIFEIVPSVEQYTGLKDRNGKEIYEGDIIESPSTSSIPNAKPLRQDILFEDGMFCVKTIDGFRPLVDVLKDIPGWTVIGNINESPELLSRTGGSETDG